MEKEILLGLADLSRDCFFDLGSMPLVFEARLGFVYETQPSSLEALGVFYSQGDLSQKLHGPLRGRSLQGDTVEERDLGRWNVYEFSALDLKLGESARSDVQVQPYLATKQISVNRGPTLSSLELVNGVYSPQDSVEISSAEVVRSLVSQAPDFIRYVETKEEPLLAYVGVTLRHISPDSNGAYVSLLTSARAHDLHRIFGLSSQTLEEKSPPLVARSFRGSVDDSRSRFSYLSAISFDSKKLLRR